MTPFEFVQVQRFGAVAEVVLNRPERKNALTGPLVADLGAAVGELGEDLSVRAVILRGAGGAFCSGLDLQEFNAEPRPEWLPAFQASWRGLHEQLFEFPKSIVCAVEGYAINAGSALALAGDLVVAGRGAFLQVGEVKQGRPGPMNLAWLRIRFGDSLARRVALLGDRIYGPELEGLGLIHCAVDDATVLETARALAASLAEVPPEGVAAMKGILRSLGQGAARESPFAVAGAAAREAARPAGPIPSLKR